MLPTSTDACGLNPHFWEVSPTARQVIHVLLTRPPLAAPPERGRSSDLHVLRTPPAFVLSQDQTRQSVFVQTSRACAPPTSDSCYCIVEPLRLAQVLKVIRRRFSSEPTFPLSVLLRCCFSLFSCSGTRIGVAALFPPFHGRKTDITIPTIVRQ